MSQLAGLAALLLLSSPAAGLIAGANRAQSETVVQAQRESEFDAKRREEASKNLQDVSFIIRLAGDKKQFRQGEVIPPVSDPCRCPRQIGSAGRRRGHGLLVGKRNNAFRS